MNQDFKNALWATANTLRGSVDPSDYKYPVLGLIFLKYVSESFSARRQVLATAFADPSDELYLRDAEDRITFLEDRNYYVMENVLWVPERARWAFIQANAKQTNIALLLDEAMGLIEADNPKLDGLLPKVYVKTTLEQNTLGSLIDLVASLTFDAKDGGDVIGDVYEYFLGNFAGAEGKNAGEFFTTKPIVSVIVEVLAPRKGKLYDGACGAGGMFVSSKRYALSHGSQARDISIYGQERNPNTWKLAAMNLAIRGLDFNLGDSHGDTFANDKHPTLRADYVFMNPPFGKDSEWPRDSLMKDPRWTYGIPPAKPAHFAWLQHVLHHMSKKGQCGIVMPNGTLTTTSGGEDAIRQRMVEDDVVECIVALPGQLFLNTQIPCCIWFLAKDKTKNGRDRTGEILFIDARKMGYMQSKVNRNLSEDDIQKIAQTVHLWREDEDRLPVAEGEEAPVYSDIPGFCKSATLSEIQAHGYVLSPGRYAGSKEAEEDDEDYKERLDELAGELKGLFGRSDVLRLQVAESMKELGYEL
ncbi:type I restriction-modification system subunit M [Massilia alkalitolerans]|uniref:type I restriction-modification system subunit M n=1 Tax=Massilia alkalitolerans TaxID=286638 RepID=UPI00068659EA|nr:class I SAM-dependent DNA methyltransferase [Massilia alkalitolerans]